MPAKLTHIGIFAPGSVKQRRASELTELGERLRQRYFESLAGRRLQVLVETPLEDRPGWLLGTSARYAPVELPGVKDQIGHLIPITAGPPLAGRIQAESNPSQ